MKKAFGGLLCICLALLFASCSLWTPPNTAVFTEDVLSITLDDSFEEIQANTPDAAFVSDKHGYAVTILREDAYLFDPPEEQTDVFESNPNQPLTLEDYGEICITAQELNARIETNDSLTYFIYDKDIQGTPYTYMVCLYYADESYWQVSFACTQKAFENARADFETFAKTVTFQVSQTL